MATHGAILFSKHLWPKRKQSEIWSLKKFVIARFNWAVNQAKFLQVQNRLSQPLSFIQFNHTCYIWKFSWWSWGKGSEPNIVSASRGIRDRVIQLKSHCSTAWDTIEDTSPFWFLDSMENEDFFDRKIKDSNRNSNFSIESMNSYLPDRTEFSTWLCYMSEKEF